MVRKILVIIVGVISISLFSGCVNLAEIIITEYGDSPYDMVAFDKGIYIKGSINGGGFIAPAIEGTLSGGTSVLFAMDTESGIHMFNVPVEKVAITFIESGTPTIGMLIGYNLMKAPSPATIKNSTATSLIKQYAIEYYIKMRREDFSTFIRLVQ